MNYWVICDPCCWCCCCCCVSFWWCCNFLVAESDTWWTTWAAFLWRDIVWSDHSKEWSQFNQLVLSYDPMILNEFLKNLNYPWISCWKELKFFWISNNVNLALVAIVFERRNCAIYINWATGYSQHYNQFSED